ncbi:hypothetical protein M0R45_008705 [Rubus argutus]|uniref:Uncharacterized protein n=1 Tax=Rubus argutus TaxID=59490 RepID=A0AAW1Y2I0_RUBAR
MAESILTASAVEHGQRDADRKEKRRGHIGAMVEWAGAHGSGLICSWWRSTPAAASRLGGAGVLNGGRDAGEAGSL